jgi:hypothetical protein
MRKNNSTYQPPSVLADLGGEFRDAKWLRVSGGNKILVLARNNNSLIFLKPVI